MESLEKKLASGCLLGFSNMYPAPGIIERIGRDWDWLWIDGQHGELGYPDLLAAVRACNLIGRPAVVRVPGPERGVIGKILDMAVEGVMVPQVEDADEAHALVQAAKFPPLGSRSYGGRRPIDLFGRAYAHPDQPQPLLICQIESEKGFRNMDSIAAVEGVNVLFFGPDDMAMRQGLPMDKPRSEGHFDPALAALAQVTRKHGKFAGGVFTTPPEIKKAVQWGYSLIVAAGDVTLLAQGSQEKRKVVRSCFEEVTPPLSLPAQKNPIY